MNKNVKIIVINVTSLNSGAEWQAEMNESSNYYQLMLANGTGVNAKEITKTKNVKIGGD